MRVVSLLPAATEIVAALGHSDDLVGITHECDHPARVGDRVRVTASRVDAGAAPGTIDAQVSAIAATGEPFFVLLESRIADLAPDLLITQALCAVCAVSETDVRALASRLAAPPAIVTLDADTLDGVLEDLRRVGVALGDAGAADRVVAGLRDRMRVVHETLRAARAPRPRVAVIEWTDPIYTAGHWVPEMVRRAGGVDVLAHAGEHSCRREVREIAAADPDVVLVAPCGADAARAADEARALLAHEAWAWARNRRVWAIDANGLTSRPGPRLIDGVETMAAILNPSLFPAPAADHATAIA